MAYYDLCVRVKASKGEKDQQASVRRLLELGWEVVAWNVILSGRISVAHPGVVKPLASVELDTVQRREILPHCSLVNSRLELTSNPTLQLRQLSRLSVLLDDIADAQALTIGNDIVRQFDIIAATPGNAKVFAHLCKNSDIEIISLDFSHRLPFQLNKKLIDEAVGRGICFELCYSAMLGSSAVRREILSSSRTLITYLRGRNFILSSCADSIGLFRGPADVMNLAVALGLNQENAMHSVSRNAALVIKHAASRKLRYLPSEIVGLSEFKTRWPELLLPEPPISNSKKRARDDDVDEEEPEAQNEDTELFDGSDEIEEEGIEGAGDKTSVGSDYLAF